MGLFGPMPGCWVFFCWPVQGEPRGRPRLGRGHGCVMLSLRSSPSLFPLPTPAAIVSALEGIWDLLACRASSCLHYWLWNMQWRHTFHNTVLQQQIVYSLPWIGLPILILKPVNEKMLQLNSTGLLFTGLHQNQTATSLKLLAVGKSHLALGSCVCVSMCCFSLFPVS